MALVKKLTKIGNSYGLILPAQVLKLVGMEPEEECEIHVENNIILLKPHHKSLIKNEKVKKAMARFMKKYQYDLKKLAS